MTETTLYENNIDFSGYHSDIKPIVLYCPQHHTLAAYLSNGNTDGATAAKSGTDDSIQSGTPYNEPETCLQVLQNQAKLAHEHGIYAFGIYYCWFSGKQLPDIAMDLLLEHPEIDLSFFLIWDNDSRTETQNIESSGDPVSQEYNPDDPIRFIQDIKKYITDPRYMKVDGKPVIGIRNPGAVPDISSFLSLWCETAKEHNIGDILIWSCAAGSDAEPSRSSSQIDAEYAFPVNAEGPVGFAAQKNNMAESQDYAALAADAKSYSVCNEYPLYRGTMFIQNDLASNQVESGFFGQYTPELFYQWNRTVVNYTRRHFAEDHRFIFVSAWNGCGDAACLEPDSSLGYAALNSLSKAIFDLPYNHKSLMTIGYGFHKNKDWYRELDSDVNIAVQLHLFYIDLIPEFLSAFCNIQHPFDLYVSTDSEYKASYFKRAFSENHTLQHWVRNLYVDVVDNQGRDVIPFLKQMQPVYTKYKYLCHLHTKKSKHNSIGNHWRQYLIGNLMGNVGVVDDILYMFESDPTVGLVYPDTFFEIKPAMEWGNNREIVDAFAKVIGIEIQPEKVQGPDPVVFPAGDMFWARTESVHQVLGHIFQKDDIPEEKGQLDGTIMHAIERIWSYTAAFNGYRTVQTTAEIPSILPVSGHAGSNYDRIFNSRMWRLVQKYYVLRDRLLPVGTLRRRIARKLVSVFK